MVLLPPQMVGCILTSVSNHQFPLLRKIRKPNSAHVQQREDNCSRIFDQTSTNTFILTSPTFKYFFFYLFVWNIFRYQE